METTTEHNLHKGLRDCADFLFNRKKYRKVKTDFPRLFSHANTDEKWPLPYTHVFSIYGMQCSQF